MAERVWNRDNDHDIESPRARLRWYRLNRWQEAREGAAAFVEAQMAYVKRLHERDETESELRLAHGDR